MAIFAAKFIDPFMNKQNNRMIFSAALLIVMAAVTRYFPHPPNFTAIGAMAIFGGATISNKKLAFILPLAALFLSDVALQLFSGTKGFYGTSQYFVYGAFMLITALSTFIKNKSAVNIVLAAVWSGIIFFVVSNFGTWVSGDIYPKTFVGLGSCFLAAIPFYQNEFFGNFALNAIYGNLFYGGLLFGIYAIMEKRFATRQSIA